MFDPAAVAPPPPAVVPLPGGVDIPPPARAALEPIVGAAHAASQLMGDHSSHWGVLETQWLKMKSLS